ncbi:MAG: greA, partial [Chlamydiales bacterium]|nr:greA [Chlamydiales bacterium]
MSYLEEFQLQVDNRDFQRLLQLWQEYCANDVVDVEELLKILEGIKKSDLALQFGRYVEDIIPLCFTLTNKNDIYSILKLVLDIETTNHQQLADLALQVLKDRYGEQPYFSDKIRLVGLRNKGNFQGAISRYELLSHIDKGKIVYHTAGWGTGEILDYSLVREEVIVEFENISGRKDLSFEKAFNTLIPLSDTHFLAKRFKDPDAFEREAKLDPVSAI